ncbi:hypothetical protein C6P46_001101 [Rhodotorula mucilaginosa]|uniref:RSC complex protein n=1 Tax=Rhodotorula mucilaginosa TaxID=5537 RepID=A0A9P7B2P7_RHOMI|nr:hypothetical protein C6P46_001101 [Rhodotorula mucilaginosa]
MGLAQPLQQVLDNLLSSLYNLQTAAPGGQKRYYSAIFRDLPDRRLYPDYYIVIKEPRCLHDVMNNMHRNLYSSPQAVAYDLFLIWSNAREYNEQGSLVYADADKLESFMERLWRERSPPLPAYETLVRPGQAPPAQAPFAPAAVASPREPERKVKRIKLTGSLASSTAGSAATTAPSPNPPSASMITAQPAPAPSLTVKLGGGRLTPSLASTSQYADSSAVASTSRSPSAVAPGTQSARQDSEDATVRTGATAAAEGATGEETKPPSIPTIPDVESGWLSGPADETMLLGIVDRLRTYTDVSGRLLATPLIDVPEPASRPDYYELVNPPISLNTIDANIRAHAYASAEACDRDLHRLFEVARLFIRPESPGNVYSDLMVLQRLYQELTKNASSADRAAEAETAASLSSVSGGPGNVQHAKGDEASQGTDYKSKATARPTLRDKIFLDSINFKGHTLRTGKAYTSGDWIHLLNPDAPGKPIIAQIWKTYKRPDSPQRCVSVCWYYRPEETVHPVSRTFYESEVFKTGVFVDHNIEDFLGTCFVMFFTRYTRGRPKAWDASMPLYVCEHRYKDDIKQFKKIKSWSSCIPEEIRAHEYDFEPYADGHVDQLARVKSPFVRGVPGPGRLDSTGPNQAAISSPSYRFSNEGRPQTAEEARIETMTGGAVGEQAAISTDTSATAHGSPSTAVGAPLAIAPVHPTTDSLVLPAASFQPVAEPSFDLQEANLPAFAAYTAHSAGTPAELAASAEAYAPLPANLKTKFRGDALGELLWFSAPAAVVPSVTRPSHSLAYLLWQTERGSTSA